MSFIHPPPSLVNQLFYRANEASPTLGCSIEISRDICRCVSVYVDLYKKYVCQNAWAELRGPNMRMLKVSLGHLKPTCDTRIIHFYCTFEQL